MAWLVTSWLALQVVGSVGMLVFKQQPASHRVIDLIISGIAAACVAWLWFVAPIWGAS